MDILKALLFPFAALYDLATRIRNHLYNTGQKRSFRFNTTVICVGNLSAGGTGKTPMTEYLVRLLRPHYYLSTLSRGYGRRTKGIRFGSSEDNATTLGDESWQLQKKFGREIKVVVGEDRAVAIPNILHRYPQTDVIILDDAFQHRTVDPQLSILLTDHSAPFFKDHILPMGRLRESRRGAERADIIVVTKCPADLADPDCVEMQGSIKKYSGEKPIFFSGMTYEDPVPFRPGETIVQNVIMVSGIANAVPFESHVRARFAVIHHFRFADHHVFTFADLLAIRKLYDLHGQKPSIVTTEKDMARLMGPELLPEVSLLPWFFIPIKIHFLKSGSDFDKIVFQSIENSKKAG